MSVSAEDIRFLLMVLPAIFFVVDPFAAVPIFVAITSNDSLDRRKALAGRAALAAVLTLSLFALAGRLIFTLFGISLGAFKVAGGLMILLMSIDMMRAQPSRTRSTPLEQAESAEREDVAVVPLAIPMLSGPGAIATVMVLMSRAAGHPVRTGAVFLAIFLTGLGSWLLLRAAAAAGHIISRTMLRVLERLMGLVLAAVAIEFLVGGIHDLLPRLTSSANG